MFGCGTVGGGVYNLIQQRQKAWAKAGLDIQITKICVRDPNKKRPDLDLNVQQTTFVRTYDDILNDTTINCVLELMGGTDDAKRLVFQAISSDKHVITANKALVAQHLPELMKTLSQHPNVRFGFEAAVCGGIPIIHTMQEGHLVDSIDTVLGIMNGTTNYMLTKMEKEAHAYADVLKEAQDLGFAEANPSADVDGLDVQSKIAILAKLAFGGTIVPDTVPTIGISRITQADFEYARMMNSTIKLLGVAKKDPHHHQRVSVYVSPIVVPQDHVIASTNGATNIVHILSSNLESSAYVGPGAGRYPTANSVLSDLVQLARDRSPVAPFPPERTIELEPNFSARFYVRIKIQDGVGIIRVIGGLAEKAAVSIHSILQAPIVDPMQVDFVVTTESTKLYQIEKMCADISKQEFVLEDPLYLPILD